ncbi:hypothetical protein C8R43DRAFT_1007201 [Mycena crocata]|nr:hypothetical protein C8R43DRAFT_1007201 [Mycena crocata]
MQFVLILFFALGGTNSPVQNVPVEVLSEIFFACLPRVEYTPASRRFAPLLVSWVCVHWRNVALSLPRLWTSLALQPKKPWDHLIYLSQSRFWLARTGRCNLSLSLHPHDPAPHAVLSRVDAPQDYTTFLTVEGYIHRCTKLDLHVAIRMTQFIQLISNAFVLTDARFSAVYASVGPSYQPVELEHLHTLHIGTSSGIEAVLRPLVLPNLRTLAVAYAESRPSMWLALISLLERSHCTLESLTYTTVRHQALDTLTAAHPEHPMHTAPAFLMHPSTQGLRRLALRGFQVCHRTLQALKLSASSPEPPVLPLLEELELGTCFSYDGDMSAVVASRCAVSGSEVAMESSSFMGCTERRLRSVTVQFNSATHMNDISRLNALGMGGLSVVIRQEEPHALP